VSGWAILDPQGSIIGGRLSVYEYARAQARAWAEANGRTFRVVPWKEVPVSKWPPTWGRDDGEKIVPSWGSDAVKAGITGGRL
jgi:hypothetical protein